MIQPHEEARPVQPQASGGDQSSSSTSSFHGSQGAEESSAGKEKRQTASLARPRRQLGDHQPVYRLEREGIYLLVIHVAAVDNTQPFSASVHVEVRSPSGGFLSVTDRPLLPFYGAMCGLYVVLGLVWLGCCALHWRDILRIQFWIGGVILLGMVEKAMFCAEYQNINNSGQATEGLILTAEVGRPLQMAKMPLLMTKCHHQ